MLTYKRIYTLLSYSINIQQIVRLPAAQSSSARSCAQQSTVMMMIVDWCFSEEKPKRFSHPLPHHTVERVPLALSARRQRFSLILVLAAHAYGGSALPHIPRCPSLRFIRNIQSSCVASFSRISVVISAAHKPPINGKQNSGSNAARVNCPYIAVCKFRKDFVWCVCLKCLVKDCMDLECAVAIPETI